MGEQTGCIGLERVPGDFPAIGKIELVRANAVVLHQRRRQGALGFEQILLGDEPLRGKLSGQNAVKRRLARMERLRHGAKRSGKTAGLCRCCP